MSTIFSSKRICKVYDFYQHGQQGERLIVSHDEGRKFLNVCPQPIMLHIFNPSSLTCSRVIFVKRGDGNYVYFYLTNHNEYEMVITEPYIHNQMGGYTKEL